MLKKLADNLARLMTEAGITPDNIQNQRTYKDYGNVQMYSFGYTDTPGVPVLDDYGESLSRHDDEWWLCNDFGDKYVALKYNGAQWVAGRVMS